MPADQRGRFHNRQDGPPVDQLGEHHESDPRRIIGAARFDTAFLVERQLLPQKEIFGTPGAPRSSRAWPVTRTRGNPFGRNICGSPRVAGSYTLNSYNGFNA
jgi:hypothetical protein